MTPRKTPARTGPAAAIARLIDERDTTQTAAAQAAGISWPAWTRRMRERDPVPWKLDELRKVAAVLDVPVVDLIDEHDEDVAR